MIKKFKNNPTLADYPNLIAYHEYENDSSSWTWVSDGIVYCLSDNNYWVCHASKPEEVEIDLIEDDPMVLVKKLVLINETLKNAVV